MDFNDLSNDEVTELIDRLKYPKTILSFEKSVNLVSSMIGRVDVNDIVLDDEELEYVLRAYRGRLNPDRFSVHLRFKDYNHHLIRIDINPSNVHTNPITNEKIYGSHVHIYSNDYDKKDSIAIPIENFIDFPNINTLIEAYNEVLEYTNVNY